MSTILDTIAACAMERMAADGKTFLASLQKTEMSFICEIKKVSPSKGVISEDFPYLDIARAYHAAGADAISCLTEPKWFQGSDDIFRAVRREMSIPMLRKDFTVDEYQIYQAKCMGADAVLLICALLDTRTVVRYLDIAHSLGLAALMETHDEAEIRSAVSAGAKIIGVNNRNLKDSSVDFTNAARLRDLIPAECVFVAESGVYSTENVAALLNEGTISIAQLHGHEDPAYIAALRKVAPGCTVWKAFKIRAPEDLEAANVSPADLVLLDNGYGTGESFDWALADGIARPYLLAGGLTPENIPQAIKQLHPYGLDIPSGVETDKQKDSDKIRAAVSAARKD